MRSPTSSSDVGSSAATSRPDGWSPGGVDLPPSDVYDELKQGSGNQPVATTMAAVRQLRDLLRHPDLGPRIVRIIPDEARTFGFDSMFRELKIYSPVGQTYEAVDHDMLLAYVEATDGQILHEGLTEAGSMGSFHAAGSSYATFGEPMIPVYIYEIAVYLEHGLERMLGNGDAAHAEDVIYYLTLYNEPVVQPSMPDHVTAEDVRRGIYRFAAGPEGRDADVRLLASGSAMTMTREAATLLADEFDIQVEVWSVPGWVQLHRDGIATDELRALPTS